MDFEENLFVNFEELELKTYVYIDYENMADLKNLLDIHGKYYFFIGKKQKSIPTEIVTCSNAGSEKVRFFLSSAVSPSPCRLKYFFWIRFCKQTLRYFCLAPTGSAHRIKHSEYIKK